MRTFRYKQNRLQQLKGFCAVVETRSVSKAANRLSLTQPTVSLQVQSLERDLRTTLFERHGPKIELTFEGELLYELARPLVEGFTALDQNFEDRRNNVEQGRLAIAAGESTIHYVLPRAVQRFSSEHPKISLALNNVTGQQGLQQLRDRLVDFCVGPLLDTPADIVFEPVVAFDPVLITALGHPLSKLRKVSLRHISQYPLILPPRHLSTWRQVEMVFLQHRLPYEVRLEMGGWEVIKRYVELGMGISIVMNVCLTGRERLEVISANKYFPKRVYGIVQLKSRALSPQARDFIATFKQTVSASVR
ncbi:MAG: LysR family transcriptional regulator [Acidobacteria bacterium]|nr:MAG: LysR family transcriptional regulator [Acidobacteriota bacterium]